MATPLLPADDGENAVTDTDSSRPAPAALLHRLHSDRDALASCLTFLHADEAARASRVAHAWRIAARSPQVCRTAHLDSTLVQLQQVPKYLRQHVTRVTISGSGLNGETAASLKRIARAMVGFTRLTHLTAIKLDEFAVTSGLWGLLLDEDAASAVETSSTNDAAEDHAQTAAASIASVGISSSPLVSLRIQYLALVNGSPTDRLPRVTELLTSLFTHPPLRPANDPCGYRRQQHPVLPGTPAAAARGALLALPGGAPEPVVLVLDGSESSASPLHDRCTPGGNTTEWQWRSTAPPSNGHSTSIPFGLSASDLLAPLWPQLRHLSLRHQGYFNSEPPWNREAARIEWLAALRVLIDSIARATTLLTFDWENAASWPTESAAEEDETSLISGLQSQCGLAIDTLTIESHISYRPCHLYARTIKMRRYDYADLLPRALEVLPSLPAEDLVAAPVATSPSVSLFTSTPPTSDDHAASTSLPVVQLTTARPSTASSSRRLAAPSSSRVTSAASSKPRPTSAAARGSVAKKPSVAVSVNSASLPPHGVRRATPLTQPSTGGRGESLTLWLPLGQLSHLTDLTFSNLKCHPSDQACSSVAAFVSVLRFSLRRLDLRLRMEPAIASEAAGVIQPMPLNPLWSALGRHHQLEYLSLNLQFRFDETGIERLSQLPRLSKVRLAEQPSTAKSQCSFGLATAVALARLPQLTQLNTVSCDRFFLTAPGIIQATALQASSASSSRKSAPSSNFGPSRRQLHHPLASSVSLRQMNVTASFAEQVPVARALVAIIQQSASRRLITRLNGRPPQGYLPKSAPPAVASANAAAAASAAAVKSKVTVKSTARSSTTVPTVAAAARRPALAQPRTRPPVVGIVRTNK